MNERFLNRKLSGKQNPTNETICEILSIGKYFHVGSTFTIMQDVGAPKYLLDLFNKYR